MSKIPDKQKLCRASNPVKLAAKPMNKGLVCYDCALHTSGDNQVALELNSELRLLVLKGQNVTCSECKGVKSIWKNQSASTIG